LSLFWIFEPNNGKIMAIALTSRDPLSSDLAPACDFIEIEKGVAIDVPMDPSDKRS
jgi:hypothetical protein